MRFNRFGSVYGDVLAMFPGSALTDFDGGGAAGQTVIETALDNSAREVAAAFTPEVYTQMTEVDCEEVVKYASSGQTTATLGLAPLISGTVHVWVYPPLAAQELRDYGMDYSLGNNVLSEEWFRKPVMGYGEASGYSVNATTGAVTSIPALGVGSRVYASYNVDVNSLDMPSVADVVIVGAAADLGHRLYSDANQEWKLIQSYVDKFKAMTDTIKSGKWVPDELRKLSYWKDVERGSDSEVSTVRLYRS